MTEKFRNNIWKIYIFKFCISLQFVGGVLVPFFLDWGGITFTQIMILQSWFMFWIFIFEIPTGSIADYLGRKHSLTLAVVMNSIGVLIYSSIPNFYIFLLGEFMWALAQALFSGAGEAFIYDTLKIIEEPEKSKHVYGKFESFGLFGYMIAAPIGSIFAVVISLRSTMLLIVVPMTFAFVIAMTFKEPKIKEIKERKSYLKILRDGVKFFYNNKILKILAFDMISIGVVAFLMIWLNQPMLIILNVNIIFFGIIQFIWVACEIVIMNNYTRLERIFGTKRRYLFFSALIVGLMFILGGISLIIINIPLALLSIIIVTAFGLTRTPLLISYMNKHIPSPERATILSTINMFRTLCLVIIYPLIGLAVDKALYLTLLILGILSLFFSFVSRIKEEFLID
jgi:predicted MFS family arabinose efflux permease